MECCESLTSSALSRRSLLLGGAAFAGWAYLPKFARAADGRRTGSGCTVIISGRERPKHAAAGHDVNSC